jgi:DNA-binding MarR family transcriptional regulator
MNESRAIAKGSDRQQTGPAIDQKRNVPALLTFIVNKLSSSASIAYSKALGVTLTEWRILVQLAVQPNISGNRICAIAGLDKASVSRAVHILEARGLIEVSAADGRSNDLALTPKGRRLHDQGMPFAQERERRLLSGLAASEREVLIDLLTRIYAQLDHVAALPLPEQPYSVQLELSGE